MDQPLESHINLDVFKFDPEYAQREAEYAAISRELLGEESSSDEEGGSGGGSSSEEEESEEEEEAGAAAGGGAWCRCWCCACWATLCGCSALRCCVVLGPSEAAVAPAA